MVMARVDPQVGQAAVTVRVGSVEKRRVGWRSNREKRRAVDIWAGGAGALTRDAIVIFWEGAGEWQQQYNL